MRKGFTLIELLVVLVILAGIASVVMSSIGVFRHSHKNWDANGSSYVEPEK